MSMKLFIFPATQGHLNYPTTQHNSRRQPGCSSIRSWLLTASAYSKSSADRKVWNAEIN
jgi:hypothetical protein